MKAAFVRGHRHDSGLAGHLLCAGLERIGLVLKVLQSFVVRIPVVVCLVAAIGDQREGHVKKRNPTHEVHRAP